MNVKLEDGSLTFKITEAELAALQAQRALRVAVVLAPDTLMVEIKPGDESAVSFCRSDAVLRLRISDAQLQQLSDMGKSKQGIALQSGGVEIQVQVDLRSDTRAWKKN